MVKDYSSSSPPSFDARRTICINCRAVCNIVLQTATPRIKALVRGYYERKRRLREEGVRGLVPRSGRRRP